MESIISNLINKHIKPYKQGSDNHLEFRREHIGCSELRKAIGTLNMVKTIIKNKLNPQSLNILPITHGVHFEDNCEEYIKHILNTNIYKAPASITNNKYPNLACSPDGIGLLKTCNFDKHKITTKKGFEMVSITPNNQDILKDFIFDDNEVMQSNNEATQDNNEATQSNKSICLFEYKSPYSREIKQYYISDDYQYQILGGMQILDICEYSCFFEAIYKQCSLGDLFTNDIYDYNYMIYSEYNKPAANILAKGIKLYFINNEIYTKNYIYNRLISLYNDHYEHPFYEYLGIDFGKESYYKDIFVGLNESMYKIINIPMFYLRDGEYYNSNGQILDKDYIIDIIKSYQNNKDGDFSYIGFTSWKMYDYQIIIEKKKDIIFEKELNRCNSIMECINILKCEEDYLNLLGMLTIDKNDNRCKL